VRTYSMGIIWGLAAGATPTPVPVASLKGCKVGLKQGKASFRGNNLDIIDVGNKGRDWTIDIQTADFRASALTLVATGGVVTTGSVIPVINEPITIAATNTAAQAATFAEDAGVYDFLLNKWMTRVVSGPTTGQYSGPVAGVYTFAAADSGHLAALYYSFTSATLGQTVTINNALQSQSVPFKVRVYNPYIVGGVTRAVGLDFASVHFEEWDGDFKVEDFAAKNLKGFASQDMIGGTQKTAAYYIGELG
jgi:hypothetical protein